IADVSNIKKDGSIEITSGGDADKHENAWDVAPLVDGLHNGWNEISLDLDKSIATDDGGADLAAINYFRIFFFTTSKDHPDVVVGIDDLRFTGK
ncbi:MAG: hypothetical protein JWQ25_3219, partial [Daejeonella sp.]|nr:hypothetical protein [Daejeonella sp.]